MKFTEVSIFVKIAFIVIAMMFVFDISGLATTSWAGKEEWHAGLWRLCSSTACRTVTTSSSKFTAVRAFEVLGFLASLAAFVVMVVYPFVPPMADKDILKLVTMVICFVACFSILVGVIIFSTTPFTKNSRYRYSFILTLRAGVMAFAAGILILVDKVKN